jgi:ABC-2 type transport system ATP-binding protein
MIELKNVTKLYKTVIGVNDITLSLEPGAYGLVGPNGSGKTTLLNLITGQLIPTLGSVRIWGASPRNNASFHRRIGYCPGLDGMYSKVSGFDWVSYLLQLHGFSRRDAAEAAEKALAVAGMADAMHRPMGNYSRGMRQRTKLAQALAHDPEWLILDEPFSGLDPVGRHDMGCLLRDWIKSGKSLLLASHILHEIEAITDSFLLICTGRLLASGSANDVHEMLADIPTEVRIRCDDAPRLGALLMEREVAEGVRFDEGGEVLKVATHKPATLYARLPEWLAEEQIEVAELHSADDSLQSLFRSLLRIHRGEV